MRFMQALTAMPERFPAGTTVEYTRTFADFTPAGGWALRLHLAGASVLSKSAAPSGDSFVVTLTASETAKLAAGTCRWVERVTHGDGRLLDVASGSVVVTADLAAARAGDLQSWEEKTLAIVEAALAGRLTSDIESYQILGRAVSKIPAKDLLRLRGELRATVSAQRNRGRTGRVHRVTFGR